MNSQLINGSDRRAILVRWRSRLARVLGGCAVAIALGACEGGPTTVSTYDSGSSVRTGATGTSGPAETPGGGASGSSVVIGTSAGPGANAQAGSGVAGVQSAAPTASGTSGGAALESSFDTAASAPTFRVEPDAGLSSFTGFMIDTPAVRMSASASPASLNAEEVRGLTQTLVTHLNDNLGESMTPTNVASAPGQTLRLRPTLARLAPRVDPTSPGGLSGVVFTQAACRIEILDAATDRLLATFVDASAPSRALSGSARTDGELANACLRLWAEQLAQRLDQARSR